MLILDLDIDKEIDALDRRGWYDYCNALASFEEESMDLGRWKQ